MNQPEPSAEIIEAAAAGMYEAWREKAYPPAEFDHEYRPRVGNVAPICDICNRSWNFHSGGRRWGQLLRHEREEYLASARAALNAAQQKREAG